MEIVYRALFVFGFLWFIAGIDRGEPVLAVLRQERMSIDDLMAAARNEGIERFTDVRLAVLETNGCVSFFNGSGQSGASDPPSVG